MGLAATISFNVPPLADTDIWFINSAAWSNYWQAIPATVTIAAAVTATYVPQAYDMTKTVYDINIDGVDKYVPSMDLHISLANQVAALDASFQNLKAALRNSGLITL